MRERRLSSKSQKLLVLSLSLAAFLVYIFSLRAAYPLFQAIQLTEPLASLQALFPLFYISLIILAAAAVLNVIFSIESQAINIWLAVIFAVTLWYTPQILSGTTYQLDGLRNIYVGEYMPQVFQGQNVIGDVVIYGRQYPASFVLNWIFMEVIRLPLPVYLNIVFPLLYLTMFVVITYLILKNLLGDRVAFIALLLAAPGMHYVQIYPSPHALGMLLTMLSLYFIVRKDRAGLLLACLAILVLVYAHPISPLILLIFMGAFLLATLVKERTRWQIGLAASTAFCFVLWFLLYSSRINITPGAIAVTEPASPVAVISQAVSSNFFTRTLNYLFGPAFIYGWVYSLARDIYFAYAGIVVALLWAFFALNYRNTRGFWKWVCAVGGLETHQFFFILSAFLLVLLTLLLGAYRMTSYDLVERSLTVLILAISVVIASLLFGSKSKFSSKVKYPVFIAFFAILTFTFPLVAYSKDAYTSMPVSEKAAQDYIYSNHLLASKTSDGRQIIIPEYQVAHGVIFDNDIPGDPKNLYVFKMTSYYYLAMRIDLSFTDNRFVKAKESTKGDPQFDCIYVNRTSAIYRRR
jgi:hypothetical protein